ncbi:MAG TPA: sulfotransferase, partial [Anaerolineae bacterium]|nr:sulfotransferase [Anaerolineae bacterium]
MTAERQPEHRRNPRLEALLDEISGLLGPVESEVAARYHMPAYPVVLVMGLPRCGSTLTMQWLAASGRFGYPSNLLSRFYAAPYVGARIQQLLTDPQFSFGDELHDLASAVGFDSTLGKTRGALAPNEFWYFWRRFIPNVEPRKLT